MSTKFLVLFQNEIQVDKDPDWTLSFELGMAFDQQISRDEPLHTHYVLPIQQYSELLLWLRLMSFETTESGRFLKHPVLNIKHLHLDSVLDQLLEIKKALK